MCYNFISVLSLSSWAKLLFHQYAKMTLSQRYVKFRIWRRVGLINVNGRARNIGFAQTWLFTKLSPAYHRPSNVKSPTYSSRVWLKCNSSMQSSTKGWYSRYSLLRKNSLLVPSKGISPVAKIHSILTLCPWHGQSYKTSPQFLKRATNCFTCVSTSGSPVK